MNVDEIAFDERGLVPVIVQDVRTRELLTLAYMNKESLARTVETGETWFWSRSRQQLWHKGETSGHTQRVVSITVDCDKDALGILVVPNGPACHKNERSCFHQRVFENEAGLEGESLGETLEGLYELVSTRQLERPEGSYTTYLFNQGLDKILKKVGEESSETIIAAKNDDRDALVRETADLLYHLVVLMNAKEITLADVSRELQNRRTVKKE